MTHKRLVWLAVMSIPALVAVGAAVYALVVLITQGPAAEVWVPTRGSDGGTSSWIGVIFYVVAAVLGFSISWVMSKQAETGKSAE
ncbi:hypothetical protein [Oerskovia flava]|uniref:hypothetical protein n=1 Tax=Oerskovia flava TaxID=2986422 RepID=UPI00223EC51E|nr:hypothetical protein [Oerskovia sp. JB1-3-2]